MIGGDGGVGGAHFGLLIQMLISGLVMQEDLFIDTCLLYGSLSPIVVQNSSQKGASLSKGTAVLAAGTNVRGA